jgi:hypothetical protein
MKPWVKIVWHFGGLLAAMVSAAMLTQSGWAALGVLGVWAIAATMFDEALNR